MAELEYRDCFVDLKIPFGIKGRWTVTVGDPIPAGHPFEVTSLRDKIMAGQDILTVSSTKKEVIHQLREMGREKDVFKSRLWMTDTPAEVWSHSQAIKNFHGRVLVGGLGLGVAVSLLENNPNVTEIVVVEQSRDVRDLVWPHLHKKKSKIITADLFKWLARQQRKLPQQKFDFAFYDIWIGVGEYNLWKRVMPLRQLSRGLVRMDHIECWKEPLMLGQVRISLEIAAQTMNMDTGMINLFRCPEEEFVRTKDSLGPKWGFYNWARKTKVHQAAVAVAKIPDFMYALTDADVWEDCWAQFYGEEVARGVGREGE